MLRYCIILFDDYQLKTVCYIFVLVFEIENKFCYILNETIKEIIMIVNRFLTILLFIELQQDGQIDKTRVVISCNLC